jgi:hypothetical protein
MLAAMRELLAGQSEPMQVDYALEWTEVWDDASAAAAASRQVDADAKCDRFVVRCPHRLVAELVLNRHRELQRLSGALEQGEDAVTGDVLHVTAVVADQRSDQPDRLVTR